MLIRYYPFETVACIIVGLIMVFAIAVYVHGVDSRRLANDPKKRNYHPLAIFLVPVSLPIILPLVVLIFLGTVLLYGGFLLVFAFLLVTFRRPFLFDWLHKFAMFVGDPLLRLNSYLIRLPFRLFLPQQQSDGNLRPVQPM